MEKRRKGDRWRLTIKNTGRQKQEKEQQKAWAEASNVREIGHGSSRKGVSERGVGG